MTVEVRIHLWIMTNLFVGLRKGEGVDFPVGQLHPYRVQMMRLLQWDYYAKRRDSTFDFLLLGEKEEVPME